MELEISSGRDVLCESRPGSGKVRAFGTELFNFANKSVEAGASGSGGPTQNGDSALNTMGMWRLRSVMLLAATGVTAIAPPENVKPSCTAFLTPLAAWGPGSRRAALCHGEKRLGAAPLSYTRAPPLVHLSMMVKVGDEVRVELGRNAGKEGKITFYQKSWYSITLPDGKIIKSRPKNLKVLTDEDKAVSQRKRDALKEGAKSVLLKGKEGTKVLLENTKQGTKTVIRKTTEGSKVLIDKSKPALKAGKEGTKSFTKRLIESTSEGSSTLFRSVATTTRTLWRSLVGGDEAPKALPPAKVSKEDTAEAPTGKKDEEVKEEEAVEKEEAAQKVAAEKKEEEEEEEEEEEARADAVPVKAGMAKTEVKAEAASGTVRRGPHFFPNGSATPKGLAPPLGSLPLTLNARLVKWQDDDISTAVPYLSGTPPAAARCPEPLLHMLGEAPSAGKAPAGAPAAPAPPPTLAFDGACGGRGAKPYLEGIAPAVFTTPPRADSYLDTLPIRKADEGDDMWLEGSTNWRVVPEKSYLASLSAPRKD